VNSWKDKSLRPAVDVQRIQLPRDSLPVLKLKLYHDGISCRLCPELSAFVCSGRTTTHMRNHLKAAHGWRSEIKRGRPSKGRPLKGSTTGEETDFEAVTTSPVSYQTFHRSNFCRYFQVTPPALLTTEMSTRIRQQDPALDPSDVLRAQVKLQLERRTQAVAAAVNSTFQPPPDLSAWLQTTQWAKYLQGHCRSAAAELAALPRTAKPEPDLVLLYQRVDTVSHHKPLLTAEPMVSFSSILSVQQILPSTSVSRPNACHSLLL
jgi:hypothetical protein